MDSAAALSKPAFIIDPHNGSTTTTFQDQSLFHTCFRLQSCDTCLSNPNPCSWCAISQVCVPNTHFSYPFAILAPIKYNDICPLSWRERWEMRAKPFSCRCSTMTLMSAVIAVLAIGVGVLLICGAVLLGKLVWRKWEARQAGWWKASGWRLKTGLRAGSIGRGNHLKAGAGDDEDEERRPLLDAT